MNVGLRAVALAIAAGVMLSGCAYKPMKAPCWPDEGGQPLAYAPQSAGSPMPEAYWSLDSCGPMKPI